MGLFYLFPCAYFTFFHVPILPLSMCLFPNITYHLAKHILNYNIKFGGPNSIHKITVSTTYIIRKSPRNISINNANSSRNKILEY